MLKAYCLELSLYGGKYYGTQRQSSLPSVQKTLEKALNTMSKKDISVRMASRLDAGVSARQYFASFEMEDVMSPRKIKEVLNHGLRDEDIIVKDVKEVPLSFDVRRDAYLKTYSYTLHLGEKDPLKDFLAWVPSPLIKDKELFKKTMALFAGEHDFSFFIKKDKDETEVPFKRIEKIEFKEEGEYLSVFVTGHAFGRHQIRLMVGCAYLVSIKKNDINEVEKCLNGEKFTLFPYLAPGNGLVLEKISYDKKWGKEE